MTSFFSADPKLTDYSSCAEYALAKYTADDRFSYELGLGTSVLIATTVTSLISINALFFLHVPALRTAPFKAFAFCFIASPWITSSVYSLGKVTNLFKGALQGFNFEENKCDYMASKFGSYENYIGHLKTPS